MFSFGQRACRASAIREIAADSAAPLLQPWLRWRAVARAFLCGRNFASHGACYAFAVADLCRARGGLVGCKLPRHDRGLFFEINMRVRTFTGTDTAAVDQQISDWIAESGVRVRRTSTAFKRLRNKGQDAITGRTTSRPGVAIAISVWYDEPNNARRSNPTNWVFGLHK